MSMVWTKEADLAAIGLKAVPEAEQVEKVILEIGGLRQKARALIVMLETCTKCGACKDQCHSYLGTKDFYNFPAARAELFRKVYKRYFTMSGRVLGRFAGAEELDAATIGKWMTYFYQCNECRRCAAFCPFGIDTAEVTIAARQILTNLGLLPRFFQGIAKNMIKTGNNMGLPAPAIIDCAEFLEEEMKDETGLDIKIPLNKERAEILYIPSSADVFTNTDTMIGVAKMFYAVGADWTIDTSILEAANFGLLFDEKAMQEHNKRLVDAARRCGAKLVVQGECGHGWRAAKMYTDSLNGPVTFTIKHVLEVADEYLTSGKITLKPDAIQERVTLHDPCNLARAGDVIEQPRRLIKACTPNFVEMTPNREENFCCGGGSGLLMDDMIDIRVKLGKTKADQVVSTQAEFVAMPCSICKAQLPVVFKHWGINVRTGGVMDLVGKAIVLPCNE
jgi:Fe-S oxidoreductase